MSDQFICVDCSLLDAKADVDGCCTVCGMDLLVVKNGELRNTDAVKNCIADADCESNRDDVAEAELVIKSLRNRCRALCDALKSCLPRIEELIAVREVDDGERVSGQRLQWVVYPVRAAGLALDWI